MAHPKVSLTVQRRVSAQEIERALAEAGARSIRVEHGAGSSDAGVASYFVFQFEDPGAPAARRSAHGFQALSSPEHPAGWTDLRLGADERGRHFIASVAQALAASHTYDESTGSAAEPPSPPPRP